MFLLNLIMMLKWNSFFHLTVWKKKKSQIKYSWVFF